MNQALIHVYFMPGMAASPKIFEYIKLPKNQFKMHFLEWIIPLDNEPIKDYALRISKHIKHDDIVLLGVSFGGILVQEIGKHIAVRKLIIVSSIKHINELPKRMLMARATKAYKVVPTQLVSSIDMFAKYSFGRRINKRIDLYRKYLAVNDSKYLSWAIKQMLCWNQVESQSDIVHIHGDCDPVFPIKNISNCITIKKGTHIIIIKKYKWFNKNLPSIILEI